MTAIRTRRLLIRRAEASDLPGMHDILSNPEAMRYWATLPHSDLDQSRAWLDAMIEAPIDVSDDFVIERKGAIIGKAGCWKLPEIGYVFHPSAWGSGYAYEALEAVAAHLLAVHAIPSIIADVDPRNAASLRLLDRLGFVVTRRAERTMELGGEWCDSVYLALSREAFSMRPGIRRT